MSTGLKGNFLKGQSLSLIIPAFNEEERISKTLQTTLDWFKQSKIVDFELLVVDDGSEDQTCICVQRFIRIEPRVRLIELNHVGRMNAVFGGLEQAMYPCVGVLDADCAVHPNEFERLAPYLDDNVIVQGSRILRGDLPPIKGKPLYRRLLSLALSLMFRLLFRVRVKDPQGAGFRLYYRETLSSIIPSLRLKHDGMKDTEIIVRAYALGVVIKEVPVQYVHHIDSRCVPPNLIQRLSVPAVAFFALLEIWFKCASDYYEGKFKRSPIRGSCLFWPIVFFRNR